MIHRILLAAAILVSIPNLQSAEVVSTTHKPAATEKIVLGGGCFWCIEAVLQRVEGVKKVISGYSGGHVPNPTYEQVCTKQTGHAEVAQVEFDPSVLKLGTLLDVFFAAHDPTTPNQQGADRGPQYRSVIFYANDEQKKAALAAKERAKKEWGATIVTEISPLKEFYPAEDYHQNYFNLNKDRNPYCSVVIAPKLHKLIEKGIIKE
ncbi:MAG: peptide-methionine (S)-S-oxide reductase MsrA [Chthoniobacteraceae bacterium]